MIEPIKVFLINDSVDNPNWGDRAAAISLKTMIEEVGGNVYASLKEMNLHSGDFKFVQTKKKVQENKSKKYIKYFLPPAVLKIKNRVYHKIGLNKDVSRVPQNWSEFHNSSVSIYENLEYWRELIKVVKNIDLVLIHGNGAMTGIRCMPRAIMFLTYLIKKNFGKPVLITNHTVDLNNKKLAKIVKNVYPLFDDVVYREKESYVRHRSLCGGVAAADSAFLFKPVAKSRWLSVVNRSSYFDVWPDTAKFDPSAPYVCVGGSSIYPGKTDSYNPYAGFSALIKFLQRSYTGQIVLTVSGRPDELFFRQIAKEQNLPLVGLRTPVQQAVDIVGNAEAYVGGRWHPSIFALSGGTPVVALSSKTFKMQALMKMCGLGSPFNALALEQEKERIGARLLSYVRQGESLRQKLSAWGPRSRRD